MKRRQPAQIFDMRLLLEGETETPVALVHRLKISGRIGDTYLPKSGEEFRAVAIDIRDLGLAMARAIMPTIETRMFNSQKYATANTRAVLEDSVRPALEDMFGRALYLRMQVCWNTMQAPVIVRQLSWKFVARSIAADNTLPAIRPSPTTPTSISAIFPSLQRTTTLSPSPH